MFKKRHSDVESYLLPTPLVVVADNALDIVLDVGCCMRANVRLQGSGPLRIRDRGETSKKGKVRSQLGSMTGCMRVL